MKKVVFNDDNLETEDVDEITTKVRGILVNEDKEVLIADYAGVYMLPGGSIEKR